MGFISSKTDVSLFIFNSDGVLIFILIYVDNIIITENNPLFLESVISKLGTEFAIRDLRPISFFLGIQVTHHSTGILLSQERYASDILTRAGMQACKLLPSPMSTSTKLHIGDSASFYKPTLYRQIVGALQYLTLTQPDLSFSV
ncbi:uncharacterized mitochondrial protein AtMg00810-like, partial [Capsicum annuum]|uniref:uncharacterized mitochondrial protein AtMg00810-like n=1 Tax=Capsicum annuum TaxID=4072 RepID=UPI001FB12EFD